jgi:wyosine [tRNA(Phe)-imidazoG37] synthetase (radical SAM superfamily)
MALFGSSKKVSATKKVRPTVVRTQNIAKEIFSIAKSYEIEPESLDFNLLEVQTYTRLNEDDKEAEWEEMRVDDACQVCSEEFLLNPNFQIKQTYEIEIFAKKERVDDFAEFKAAVGANATKCKVYLSIAQGSKIAYQDNLDRELLDFINRKKVRAGILIDIFDDMLEPFVSKFSAKVQIEEKLEIEQNETYLIAEGIEPTATKNDELILHYEKHKNDEVDENERVNYAERGFIQSVKEGELLIEYVKAQMGKPGRNCRGEYMQPKEPIITQEPTFKVDESIKVIEDKTSIKYYATENGYIAFENNTYLIKKEVDVKEVSFKTTGSIQSGVDSDVNISVKEADAIKDAVGSGMVVEVTEIEVEGNVGSNAKVIAKKAHIGGQTHKSAVIDADEVDINVHKGKAYGNNVHITRLEHGEVDAKKASVTQAVGGTICAQEVDIEICASHVKVTASNKIEIHKLIGSENTFVIDPLLNREARSGVEENEEQIKALEAKIKDLRADIKKYTKFIKDGTKAFLEIKKRLIHYKKSGVKMPESFVKKYKQFQKMQEKLQLLKEDYSMAEEKLNLLSKKSANFQEDIFEARVINRDKWQGYNEIKFRLIDPPQELVYKPVDGSHEHVFGVVEIEEGEYAIRPLNEEVN